MSNIPIHARRYGQKHFAIGFFMLSLFSATSVSLVWVWPGVWLGIPIILTELVLLFYIEEHFDNAWYAWISPALDEAFD